MAKESERGKAAEASPQVSVVIPVRNEEAHIAECLQTVLAQDYPMEQLEVLVVDGVSSDRSREIVASFISQYSNVRLLDNPRHIIPAALNIGIANARGQVIIRVDARCRLARDYVRRCIEYLRVTGADNVGGPMRAVGRNYLGQAIALATSSLFGIGDSKFHYLEHEEYVDTVYLGAYHRESFTHIGLFDETLAANEDYELNYRLRVAGGKIFCTPVIKSIYYCRDSFPELWKQYFKYGFWKAQVIRKHPRSTQPRHLIAPSFVSTIGVAGLFSLVSRPAVYLFLLVLTIYVLFSLAFSIAIALRKGWQYLPILPVVFTTLHLSWGSGFLWGLVRVCLRRLGFK
jgi:glycosyltransferase involved in cell wall biosynthesis